MKAITAQEISIIRTAIDNFDKVVNTLAYVRDDNETEYQISSLVSVSINQIIRDVNALNIIFNSEKAGD
jgi:hypothetical protein